MYTQTMKEFEAVGLFGEVAERIARVKAALVGKKVVEFDDMPARDANKLMELGYEITVSDKIRVRAC